MGEGKCPLLEVSGDHVMSLKGKVELELRDWMLRNLGISL